MYRNETTGLNPLIFIVTMLAGLTSVVLLAVQPQPLYALLPPLGIPVLLFLAKRPELGYYLVIFLVPLSAWATLQEDSGLTIGKLVAAWVVVVLLLTVATRPENMFDRLRSRMWYPLIAFGLFSILSIAVSNFIPVGINDFRRYIISILFVIMTMYFIGERQIKVDLPVVLIVSLSISAAIAVVGGLFDMASFTVEVESNYLTQRAVGVSTDPNFFGAVVLVSLPLLSHYIFEAKARWVRTVCVFLLIINSYAIILTYSRAITLVFMATALILLFENRKRFRPKHLGFATLLLAALAVYWVSGIEETTVWQRMMTLFHPQEDTSLQRRSTYLDVGWESFKQHPLIGTGPGTFPFIYEQSIYAPIFATEDNTGFQRRAHNTYMEVLVGNGLAGLFLYLGAIMLGFRYLYIVQKKLALRMPSEASLIRAYGYGFLVYFVSLLSLSEIYHKYTWLFFGLSAVIYRIYMKDDKIETV